MISSWERTSSFMVSRAEASWPISSLDPWTRWAWRLPAATSRAVADSTRNGLVTIRTVTQDRATAAATRSKPRTSRSVVEIWLGLGRPDSQPAKRAVTTLPTIRATISGDTILTSIEARTLVANVRRARRGAFESVLIAAWSSYSALRTGAHPSSRGGPGSRVQQ